MSSFTWIRVRLSGLASVVRHPPRCCQWRGQPVPRGGWPGRNGTSRAPGYTWYWYCFLSRSGCSRCLLFVSPPRHGLAILLSSFPRAGTTNVSPPSPQLKRCVTNALAQQPRLEHDPPLNKHNLVRLYIGKPPCVPLRRRYRWTRNPVPTKCSIPLSFSVHSPHFQHFTTSCYG